MGFLSKITKGVGSIVSAPLNLTKSVMSNPFDLRSHYDATTGNLAGGAQEILGGFGINGDFLNTIKNASIDNKNAAIGAATGAGSGFGAGGAVGDRAYLEQVTGGRKPGTQDFTTDMVNPGMSAPVQKIANEQNKMFDMQSDLNRDQIAARTMQGNLAGQQAMAMKGGGLSSGAMERLNSGANRDMATQIGTTDYQGGIAKMGAYNDLAAKDYASKLELGKSNTDARNLYNMNMYTADNQLLGAKASADATRAGAAATAASKGPLGSWLCTRAHDLETNEFRKDFMRKATRKLRKYCTLNHTAKQKWYIEHCQKFANKITKPELDFVLDCHIMIETDGEEKAVNLYETNVVKLLEKYEPRLAQDYKAKFGGK